MTEAHPLKLLGPCVRLLGIPAQSHNWHRWTAVTVRMQIDYDDIFGSEVFAHIMAHFQIWAILVE